MGEADGSPQRREARQRGAVQIVGPIGRQDHRVLTVSPVISLTS